MNNAKLYVMGKREPWPTEARRTTRGRYTYRSYFRHQYHRFLAWAWKWVKRGAFITGFFLVLWSAYFIGTANGQTLSATNIVTVAATSKTAPVMERIATAESKGHQYGPSGQVLIHVNNNGTVDMGKYQINSIWFAEATKLGYDLTKESDNEAFAMYLYAEKGTSPWSSSQSGWNQ